MHRRSARINIALYGVPERKIPEGGYRGAAASARTAGVLNGIPSVSVFLHRAPAEHESALTAAHVLISVYQ
jgi:hypothetical protein